MVNSPDNSNPYEVQSDATLMETLPPRRPARSHRPLGVLLILSIPCCLLLETLEARLLASRVLNTRDLAPLVGHETGTVSEYLLNVWHWDAAIGILMLMSLPMTICGAVLLHRSR